jgi:two-component SAPR family response regulator
VFDTTLHRLRRQLGSDDAILLTDGRVHFDDKITWVDLWALDRAIKEIDREIARCAPPDVLANWARRLLALYRGPLLGDETSDWAAAPREQWNGRFLGTAERLAAALRSAARNDEADALEKRTRVIH